MSCSWTDPVGCVTGVLGGAVGDVASSAWDSICKSFADAATEVLQAFAKTFVNIPNVDVASSGIKSVYGISLGLAGLVAALLLIGQVIRTAITHDGSALAHGLVGVGKAALAFMLTLTIAGTSLAAADEITRYIVDASFGGTQQFSDKIAKLVAWDPSTSASLILVFAVIAILLTVVLWFEMLLRNAAFGILIATSPIAASGQVSETTKAWWSKLVATSVQLVILKPIVALVFALGFNMAGSSQDVETTLAGMLVLLLAAVAWPAVARFFSFASVQVGGGAGLGALLGFAGGRLSAGAAGGAPSGASPDEFGQQTANQTMAAFARRNVAGQAAGAAGGGAAGGIGGAAAAAGPIGLAIAGVTMAQRAVNSLTGRMEQMAGHAGIQGANPYAQPAGQPQHRGPTWSGGGVPTTGSDPSQPSNPGNPPGGQEPGEPAAVQPAEPDHPQAQQEITPHPPVSGPDRTDPPTAELPVTQANQPASQATGADTTEPNPRAVPPSSGTPASRPPTGSAPPTQSPTTDKSTPPTTEPDPGES